MKKLFDGQKPGTAKGRRQLRRNIERWFKYSSALSFIERAAIASELIKSLTDLAAKYRVKSFEQEILPDADLRDYIRLDDNGQPYDSTKFGKKFRFTDKNGHEYYVEVQQSHPKMNARILNLAKLLYDYNEIKSANPDDKVELPTSGNEKIDACAMSLVALDEFNFAMFQIQTYQKDIKKLEAEIEEMANDLRWQVGLPELIYKHDGTIKVIVE